MERVAFLIEATGERIGCMLNPNSVLVRRAAGLRPLQSLGGGASGSGTTDDPLLFSGGGTTELLLELLFDVSVGGSTVHGEDVRELTRPLWGLAENGALVEGERRPPRVRLVWGKRWNFAGVVAAVAERLEHFTADGAPRRSWMKMRLLRVEDRPSQDDSPIVPAELTPGAGGGGDDEELLDVHEVLGEGQEAGAPSDGPRPPGERLDEIAARYFGDPAAWRQIADANGLDDPLRIPGGTVLQIPSGRSS